MRDCGVVFGAEWGGGGGGEEGDEEGGEGGVEEGGVGAESEEGEEGEEVHFGGCRIESLMIGNLVAGGWLDGCEDVSYS